MKARLRRHPGRDAAAPRNAASARSLPPNGLTVIQREQSVLATRPAGETVPGGSEEDTPEGISPPVKLAASGLLPAKLAPPGPVAPPGAVAAMFALLTQLESTNALDEPPAPPALLSISGAPCTFVLATHVYDADGKPTWAVAVVTPPSGEEKREGFSGAT